MIIGFFVFQDICNATVEYMDYLKDGDSEKLAGMIEDALWAGLFDLAVFAGGRILKKLADSVDLKIKDCMQWPEGGNHSGGLIKEGLGILSGKEFNVTQTGIDNIRTYLTEQGFLASYENRAMLERLENALTNGKKITGADAVFYTHELKEAELVY